MTQSEDPCREPVDPTLPNTGWKGAWSTTEGRVLLVGLALALVGLLALVAPWMAFPERFHPLVTMSVTHLLVGRAAAMSLGYAQGLGHGAVVGVNLFIEVVLVLLFYPLFALSCRSLPLALPLHRAIARARSAATRRSTAVRRFGMAGLLLFVWAPFWMTGPVVGSFVGFLMGLRTWITLTVVLAGTSLAIVCWAFFLQQISELASRGGNYGPLLLAAAVIAAVLVVRWLQRDPDPTESAPGP